MYQLWRRYAVIMTIKEGKPNEHFEFSFPPYGFFPLLVQSLFIIFDKFIIQFVALAQYSLCVHLLHS